MLAIVNAEDARSDTALIRPFGKCEEAAQSMAVLLTDSACMKSNALSDCFTERVGCAPGILLLVQMITWQVPRQQCCQKSSDATSRALMLKMVCRCAG